MGTPLGQERFAAHKHGHSVVVCRPRWDLALAKSRGQTKKESHPRNCDPNDRLGDECPPARPGVEHPRAQRLWLHPHGRRRQPYRGNQLCPARPHGVPRTKQLPISPSFRKLPPPDTLLPICILTAMTDSSSTPPASSSWARQSSKSPS